ncbi:hypothetical protein [Aquimarina sp. SS2-1]|uniref:hypothetical protein n=1 Tax=Aquimarina besae TaxID=3342247 RepID=UPI00366CAE08
MKKITLDFGNPEHGWLPVALKHEGFKLNFDASDVPKIPTNLLCECLIFVLKGLESKMYCFLEPGYYLFEFVPNGEAIDLSISASDDSSVKQKEVHKISGCFESIVLPMYQTLKKFNTFEFNDYDWEKIDRETLDKLTQLVHKRKTAC